jgi:predicted chitinase
MAKQKKFKSADDMGFDSSLNIPSFDYSEKRVKDDRNPAIKAGKDFAKGVGSGIWDASRSDSFIRKTLKSALPQGYGSALDLADQTGQSLKSLYDSSAREVKPLLNDMKRATKKLMPAGEKFLPKAVSDRLKKWSDSYEDGASGVNADSMRDQSLQAQLGDIFKYQAESHAQARAEDKAEADIRHQMQNNKDNMQLGMLNGMRLALQRLVDYQDKVTVNYQRKALEVQYRHYFVAMDSLQLQRESAVKTKELLENIQKNTGLPDVLKIKVSQDYPTLLRNKFFSTMGQSLMGSNSQFMQKLTASITNSIQGQVKGFVDGARMGISGMEMGMDAASALEGMGGPGGAEMAGSMVGGQLAGGLAGKLGKKLGGWARKSKYGKQIEKGSNGLEYVTGNVPQHLMELAMSEKGNDLPFGLGRLAKWGKDRVKEAGAISTGIERDNLRNLQEPAVFNGLARKSLTEVIPGYLARIYQELQIMRTGNTKVDLTTFDPTSGKFKSRAETGKAIYNSLFSEGSRGTVKRSADTLVGELEKQTGKKISPELRKALLETLREDNLNRRIGSPERLGAPQTYFNREHYMQGPEMSQLFRDYFKGDQDGSRKMRFQKLMTDLSYSMPDGRSDIQTLMNSGYGDYVNEMGLLDKTGNFINLKRFQNLFDDGSYDPQALHAAGGLGMHGFAGNVHAPGGHHITHGRGRGIGQRVKSAVHSGLGSVVTNIKGGKRVSKTNHDHRQTVTYGGDTYYVDRQGNITAKVDNRSTTHNRTSNSTRNDNRSYNTAHDSHDQYNHEIHNHINSVVNHIVNEAEKRLSVAMGGARGYGRVKGASGVQASPSLTHLQQAQQNKAERHAKKRLASYQRRRKVSPVKNHHLVESMGYGASEVHFAGQDAIIHAIEANSSLSVAEQMLEQLTAIRKKFDGGDGMTINNYQISGEDLMSRLKGGAGQAGSKIKGLYQMTVGDALSGAWQGVKNAKNWVTGLPGRAWDKGKEGWQKSKAIRDQAGKLFASGKQKALNLADRWDDIYIPGLKEPALLAWKLRAGHYRDRVTGDIIHSYKDIKGDIEDIYDNNNLVLSLKDIKYAYTIGGGKKLITALGAKLGKFAKMGLEWWNNSGSVFDYIPKAIDWGKKTVDLAVHFLDQPIDIYVKGKSEPVLLARTMKAGGYISTLTGKPVFRPGQIDGPIMDQSMPKNPRLALTREDLAGGLYDWQGKPVRTAGQKVMDTIKKPFLKIKGLVNDGLSFAANLIKKPFEAIGQFFFNWFGKDGIVFSGSKTMITRLTEIRDLLEDRLPKPKRKGSWQDLEDKLKGEKKDAQAASGVNPGGSGLFGTMSSIGAGIKGLFGHFKKQDAKDQADKDKENKEKNKSWFEKIKDQAIDKGEDALQGYAWEKGKDLASKKSKTLGKKALEKLAKKKGLGKLGALATLLEDAEELAKAKDKGHAAIKAGKDAVTDYAGTQAAKLAGKKLFGKFAGRTAAQVATRAAATTGIEAAAGAATTAAGSGAAAAGTGALAAGAEGTIAGLGLELGLGSVLAAGLGMAATAVAGIIASPVVLGAAAVTVAGLGLRASYKGIKHAMSKKVLPLEAVRMAQYGVMPDDWEKVNDLREFEESMLKHVIYDENGKAQLDKKKFSADEAFGPFGVDKNNKQDLRSWLQWFSLRFKPVFLTTMTALHGVDPKASLKNVDKMDKELKLKFLSAIANPAGPYGFDESPWHTWHVFFIHGKDGLKAGRKEVAALVAEARKTIEKESDLKGTIKKLGSSIMDGILGREPAKDKDGKVKPQTTMEKLARGYGKFLKYTPVGWAAMGLHWLGGLFDKKKDDPKKTGKTTASVGISPTLTKIENKVDALSSLRFRTYGLKALEQDKVTTLKTLEEVCLPLIAVDKKLNDYQCRFTGDPHDVLKQVGASFGVSGTHNTVAYRWVAWFMRRFLPTYLTYVGSLMKATGKKDIHQTMMEPMVAAKLAPLIVASKSPEGKSVWEITDSPWQNYELNTDQKSVEQIMDFLNDKVSAKTLNDGVTDKTKTEKKPKSVEAGDGGKGWTDQRKEQTNGKSFLDSMKETLGNAWNGAKTAVSNVYNKAKTALGNAYDKGKAVVSGVGDSMKGFGATLGKAYKAVTGSAKQVKDAVMAALAKAGITNPTEQAMFMAQMDHESGGFKSLSENLNYKPSVLDKLFGPRLREAGVSSNDLAGQGAEAIANVIYGGKFGRKMGNTDPGDGFKYRGRGVVQLTGKANYARYGKMIGVDLLNNPDLASDPKVAAQLAVAYWKDRVSSSAAQAGDVKNVTYAVNGGLNGLDDRQSKFQKYLADAKAGKLNADGAADGKDGKPDAGATGVTTVSSKNDAGHGNAGLAGADSKSDDKFFQGKNKATPELTDAQKAAVAKSSAAAGNAPSGAAPSPAATGTPTPAVQTNAAPADSGSSEGAAGKTKMYGQNSGSAPDNNPFGFGLGSAQAVRRSPAQQIAAVQQAQHEDKMAVMGNVGDVLNKQLGIQTESRDVLKNIYAMLADIQKGQPASDESSQAPNPNVSSKPQPQMQQMVKPPVSMSKMV